MSVLFHPLLAGAPAPLTPSCEFKKMQFFARVELFTEWPFGGGVDLWNASIFWAHDGPGSREHLVEQDVVRSLSSGATLNIFNSQRLTTGGTTYNVDSTGNCTEAKGSVAATACTGSVVPFLPDAMLAKTAWNSPETAADKYLNTTTLDGEAVAVFGWDSYCAAGTILNAQHRVYVALATGMPVLETQKIKQGCDSYGASTTIRYTIDANSFGSVEPLFDQPQANTFAVPPQCAKPPATTAPAAAAASSAAIANATTDEYCCTCCSAGGCSAWYSPTNNPPGHACGCTKGATIKPIPGHGEDCELNASRPAAASAAAAAAVVVVEAAVPAAAEPSAAPNATAFCCATCSAGGCSAHYSPVDESIPPDAGMCIHGGTITELGHEHGQNCGTPAFCCDWCGAGGCSAEYSMADECDGAPGCGCVKGGHMSRIDGSHGFQCLSATDKAAPIAVA